VKSQLANNLRLNRILNMEFYSVIKELLFKDYFFYWFVPYVCWVLPACHRVFYGNGSLFSQEVKIDDVILDYEA